MKLLPKKYHVKRNINYSSRRICVWFNVPVFSHCFAFSWSTLNIDASFEWKNSRNPNFGEKNRFSHKVLIILGEERYIGWIWFLFSVSVCVTTMSAWGNVQCIFTIFSTFSALSILLQGRQNESKSRSELKHDFKPRHFTKLSWGEWYLGIIASV